MKSSTKSDKAPQKGISQNRASTKVQKRAMIEALTKSLGVVTSACKKVGIDRATHYKWYAKDPKYKQRVDDIGEIAVDFAESKLHQKINNGDIIGTIFYLKTKGKHRGYVEKTETEISGAKISVKIKPLGQ